MSFLKRRFPLLLLLSLAFSLALIQNIIKSNIQRPSIKISRQDSTINFNENIIKSFNFGQSRLISSLLWIHTMMESDLEHYKKKDLNSWMYHRFKMIAVIEPHFYENYFYGGQYLSVIKDDIYGAQNLLKIGLNEFPKDFWLNFYQAYNYYFELKNLDQAFIHYDRIKDHPLTKKYIPYLPSLMAKLKMKGGHLEFAYQILKTSYEKENKKSPLKNKFYKELIKVKNKIDCSKNKNCN